MHKFALIGAAGYVAPRHLKAIKETGNDLVAILDPHDSVGIIDSYFPGADYFRETERFDRHLDKLRRKGNKKVEYVTVASPNYLHDAHIRLALRNEANAICEKPLVLNPWNVDALEQIVQETGKSISVILQLRLHPVIIALKTRFLEGGFSESKEIDLTYITSRGNWYDHSWKGDLLKSGGVATNIGIHFFDMLIHLFGSVQKLELHYQDSHTSAGFLVLDNAKVRWFMSVSEEFIPEHLRMQGVRTYRSIRIGEEDLEFSGGFTDLHTRSYESILAGKGFSPSDARSSIELAYRIRNAEIIRSGSEFHPFTEKIL